MIAYYAVLGQDENIRREAIAGLVAIAKNKARDSEDLVDAVNRLIDFLNESKAIIERYVFLLDIATNKLEAYSRKRNSAWN